MIRRVEDNLVRWTPRLVVGLGVIVVLLAGVAVYTLTQYQPKTACADDPQGRECQNIRADGAKAQSKRVACIAFRQVGYVCPAPKSKVRQELSVNGSTKEENPDDPSDRPAVQPSSPDGPPAPGDASSGVDGDGDSGAPSSGGSSDTPSTGDEGGEEGGGGEPPAGEQPDSPPSTIGQGVGDIVDGATGTVCGATGSLGVPVCLP